MTEKHAADIAERLWRAYAPFPRGRNTIDDLTFMLEILVLARFVEVEGGPADDFVERWNRALAEAPIGVSPLTDLRAAMRGAVRHPRFPLTDLADLSEGPDDMPWVAAFLTVLEQHLTVARAELPEVCELLLERHAQERTTPSGEFFTPRGVVRLVTELASPQPGDRILDPACGSGGLLAAAARRLTESARVDGASFEAYATDRDNLRLAMTNLAIHGVDRPVVRPSDPRALLQSRNHGLVDRVVGNPPFNQRIDDVDAVHWPFGPPPRSSANFAWLQLAWARLSRTGIAAMIMPPGAAWSGGREAEIRKDMIAGGVLLGVIALPPNLFAETAIPVHVWLLARDKSHQLPPGDETAVLFVDAGRLGTQAPRQPRVLTAEDIERISGRVLAWRRSPSATPDEAGFSRSVTHAEILENDGNVDPRRYVDVARERSASSDVPSTLQDLDRHAQLTSDSGARLRRSLSVCERLSHSGIDFPRVPLRSIVEGAGTGRGLLIAGPSGSLIRAQDYVESGGVPVVMPKDLTGTGFSRASVRQVTEQQAGKLRRFRLSPGDVVLVRRGELGRCAVVGEEQRGWVCGTGCFLLRPPAGLDAGYVAAYLRSPEARDWLETHTTGSTTMKTISLKVLGELPVVLPDLEVQRAVADATALLDEHERLLRLQLATTREARRSALNGLFTAR